MNRRGFRLVCLVSLPPPAEKYVMYILGDMSLSPIRDSSPPRDSSETFSAHLERLLKGHSGLGDVLQCVLTLGQILISMAKMGLSFAKTTGPAVAT